VLIFDAAFEGGNVANAKRIDESNEWEITLNPDTNNSK
jgi:hypothetical protein